MSVLKVLFNYYHNFIMYITLLPILILLSYTTYYITKKICKNKHQNFYKKIQPGGPGWKKIIDISESSGINIVGKKEKWDVPTGILCMLFGSISVYSILFGIGYILYSQTSTGLIFILISIVSIFILMRFWRRLST